MDSAIEGISHKKANPHRRKIGAVAVCTLAIGRMIGTRCKYWNRGLSIDLEYIYAYTAIDSLLMIIVACSLAEMSGALPFTGKLKVPPFFLLLLL